MCPAARASGVAGRVPSGSGDYRGRVPWVLVRYLGVAVLARLADEGARVALLLLAISRTGSTAFAGLLVAALMVPHVLAAPVAGALADRVRRRRPLYVGFLLAYGLCLGLCGVLTGRAPAAVVLAVAVLGGCFGPLLTGGLSSLVRGLVSQRRRERAYALDVMSYGLAGICGPAVVALSAVLAGPAVATGVLAASAAAGGVLLATLPIRGRRADAGGAAPAPVGGGVTALWQIRHLRAVTAATSLGALAFGALPVVAAVLAVQYGAGYAAGALISAAGAGGLLGSLAYARCPVWADRPERVVMACLFAGALPLALVPVVPGVGAGLVLFTVSGFFTGPQSSALFASRDRHAPVAVHTQVFTLGAGLKMTAAALGAALAGIGAGLGGAVLVLAVAGCHAAAAGVGAAILRPRPAAA